MNLRSCCIIFMLFSLVKCVFPNAKEVAGRKEQRLNELYPALHNLREQYGHIKDVKLTRSKTSTSTEFRIDNHRWVQAE